MTKTLSIKKLVILSIPILLTTNIILSQNTEKKEMAKLSFLMGKWLGTSKVYNGKDTTQVNVKENVYYILNGNILVLDVESPSIHLHTLITYSIKDNCYYYQPYQKTGGSKYKGELKDGKFVVHFNSKNRLIFEKTEKGEFHEFGENIEGGKWQKNFEDVLLPTSMY